MTHHALAMQFFLQFAIILGTVRLVGMLARTIDQPQGVGEMIADVILGLSLLAVLAPGVQAPRFPPTTQSLLSMVSQIGVVLYMCIVGTEFQVELVRQRVRSALAVSAAGIVQPFCLGGVLAYSCNVMREHAPDYAPYQALIPPHNALCSTCSARIM